MKELKKDFTLFLQLVVLVSVVLYNYSKNEAFSYISLMLLAILILIGIYDFFVRENEKK